MGRKQTLAVAAVAGKFTGGSNQPDSIQSTMALDNV
jgi:hypothetical protein